MLHAIEAMPELHCILSAFQHFQPLSSSHLDPNEAAKKCLWITVKNLVRCSLQALNAVQQDLDGLSQDCTHINGALAGAKAASAEMSAEAERLGRELAASQQRSRLAQQFLQQYQLSPEEVAALQVTPCNLAMHGRGHACS